MAKKIILSRKGFDSKYGEKPSPILQDGTLLSIPIPLEKDSNGYFGLEYKGKTYAQLLQQLRVKQDYINCSCHLDPDIYKSAKVRDENWRACFGQSDGALTHLESKGVDKGDIFLFFGWFKQTVELDGKISYLRGAQDKHIIFGYLQVDKKVSGSNLKECYWHPHANGHFETKNIIYKSSDYLLDTDLPGFGTFKLSKDLILTKDGYSRSKWELPECLENVDMTYHDSRNKKMDYFQSAMIGQEFIMDSNPEIEIWIISLAENNRIE